MLRPPRSVTDAHWRRLERIRAQASDRIIAQWRRTGFDGPDIAQTVQSVLSAQRAVVAVTDADLAATGGILTRSSTAPIGLDAEQLIGRHARNGVLLETVYARPPAVAAKSGFDAGVTYLRQAIYLDAQLAQRRAANAIVESDKRVIGWRRQVNPVVGGKTCGLCVAASAQMYRKADLLPIHPMCRCSVYPVYTSDPIRGDVIDRERLNAVYARTSGSTSDLGRVRFSADELPAGIDTEAITELGPRVAWHPEMGEYLTGARHDSSFSV